MFETIGEEIKMLSEMALKFARKELRELAEPADHYPDSPYIDKVVAKAEAEGLLSLVAPEEFEGMGSLSALGAVLYETGQVYASFGAILLVHSAAQSFVLAAGSDATKKKFFGKKGLTAFPLYDEIPDWGAGVEAKKTKGGYTLDGEARFIPLAPVAERLVLAARCGESPIVFLVEKGAKGLKVGAPLVTLGLRACPVADVSLKGVKIAKADILAEGEAAGRLIEGETSRLFGPASALSAGVAEGSYQEAMEYAKERYQGGKNISEHQQVRIMLADMAADARRGLDSAAAICRAADEGVDPDARARTAFIQTTDASARACIDGVQLLGGYGYMQDYGQERRMRDSKQVQLILGRNDMHRLALMESEIES